MTLDYKELKKEFLKKQKILDRKYAKEKYEQYTKEDEVILDALESKIEEKKTSAKMTYWQYLMGK